MPFTVITLKKVPPYMRGDLTKWMQEIDTGVYIGNFNTKIREELWKRVKENVGQGEATISYTYRNEIGYKFETMNTQREEIDFEGIPLVLIKKEEEEQEEIKENFSKASKTHKARKYSQIKTKSEEVPLSYVVIDIETDGLSKEKNKILEIGAVKIIRGQKTTFERQIKYEGKLPREIKELTGIREEELAKGVELKEALKDLAEFVGDNKIAGYNVRFDMEFINENMEREGLPKLTNKLYDIMKYVKKEKEFQKDYKLSTTLKSYGIEKEVPHRALLDAELTYELSMKVNKFKENIK